ncbi:UNVERIFIED_CONTAM: Retrovirus-related Pol polyprotein from transposon [Sesamum indicum]
MSGPIPGKVKKFFREFDDVIPQELPRKLPPKRAVDYEIELVPGTKHPTKAPYRMSQLELVELRKQLKDMLESGIIKPAKLRGGLLRPSKMSEIFYEDRLEVWLLAGPDQGDEAKTMVVTRHGAFEFLVMPFVLMNAPATFSNMNQVIHDFLDEFVVVYLDDIVIYSGTLAEYVNHLRQVLTRLREHKLYAKVSKCSFAQETISFLGHIVERGHIRMDPKKVQAIEEWRPPSDLHDLRSFLDLANYYRRFVKSYSKIALPLMDLFPNAKSPSTT